MSPIEPTVREAIFSFGPLFILFLLAALVLVYVTKKVFARLAMKSSASETETASTTTSQQEKENRNARVP